MSEKRLVKVTLNKATDPDLFAYIMQFDNPRQRAGALRAIARVAFQAEQLRLTPGASLGVNLPTPSGMAPETVREYPVVAGSAQAPAVDELSEDQRKSTREFNRSELEKLAGNLVL